MLLLPVDDGQEKRRYYPSGASSSTLLLIARSQPFRIPGLQLFSLLDDRLKIRKLNIIDSLTLNLIT